MNASTSASRLGDLILLRYQLQWAAIRGKPGAIAASLVLAAVFVVLLVGSLAAGLGIGLAGLSDRAAPVLRLVLGVMFLNLLVVPIMLGFGLSDVFSPRTLRQYPLSRIERLLIQYGLGLFEPLWLLALALYTGLAAGAWALGAAPLWLTLPAALLLVAANYATARLILAVIGRLLTTQAGSFALVGLMQLAFLLPLALQHELAPSVPAMLRGIGDATPPFAAAALMTGSATLAAPLVLLAWCAVPTALLLLLDGRPPAVRQSAGAAVRWDTVVDRLAALFPGTWEPLVGRTLRYYLRNPRLRINLVVTLPLLAFFVSGGIGPGGTGASTLERAALFAPLAATLITLGFAINAFGYDGAGLRRLLLCPVAPGAALRVQAAVLAALGVAYLWATLAVWTLLAQEPVDLRLVVLLLTHGCAGMLLFHGVGFWTSILAPKRVNYEQKFRDDASLGGQITMMGLFLLVLVVPIVVRAVALSDPLAQYWWLTLGALGVMLVVHQLLLASAARRLPARREALLAVVEGRT